MEPPKAAYAVVILVLFCCFLEHQEYTQPVKSLFEQLMSKNPLSAHGREKRATNQSSIEYRIEISISLFDLEALGLFLSNISFPALINNTGVVTSINVTTECASNLTAYQCTCKDNYAWSNEQCTLYEACDPIIGNVCGCIKALPPDNQFCQLNTTRSVISTTPALSTTPAALVYIDVDIDLRFSVPIMSSNIINEVSKRLSAAGNQISPLFQLVDFNITTECSPNPSGMQCKCGDQFTWSCDKCDLYGACSNTTRETCSCINAIPEGQYCEPISSVPSCPISTPVTTAELPSTHPTSGTIPTTIVTTRMPTPTTTPTTTTTTTKITSAVTDPHITDLVFDLRIPIYNGPYTNSAIGYVLQTMQGFLPYNVLNVKVLGFSLTTVCVSKTTGELTCECQDQYAWSCAKCKTYVGCNYTSTDTCCINGNNVSFCELSASIPSCPTTPVTSTATTTVTTTATTTVTTTVTTASPTTVTSKILTFTMDLDFKDEYNAVSNPVYVTVLNTIDTACRGVISDCKVRDLNFTPGSTVATYTVDAASINSIQVQQISDGVISGILKNYPIIFEGTALKFSSSKVIFGTPVIITCESPDASLNFGQIESVTWTIDGATLSADAAKNTLTTDNTAILTDFKFAQTGQVSCVCMLRAGNKILRRKGIIEVLEKPDIKVTPFRDVVICGTAEVTLTCSVQSPYKVKFEGGSTQGSTVSFTYKVDSCIDGSTEVFKCQWVPESFAPNLQYSEVATLRFANQILCNDETFGPGPLGYIGSADCDKDKTGEKTAECMANGKYENVQDNCVLKEIQNLLDLSAALLPVDLLPFLKKLSNVTQNISQEINKSPATVGAIVKILDNVANVNTKIDQSSMTFVLETSGILTRDDAKDSWSFLNKNDTKTFANSKNSKTNNSRSSLLLDSLERLTGNLSDNSFVIGLPSILLNKTTFTNDFNFNFSSSVEVDIPQSNGGQKSLTVIVFSSLNNVLPPRDQVNSSDNLINGKVALIRSNGKINNISLTFNVLNDSLSSPKCVYWNFSLFNGLGGWDDEGCFLVHDVNGTVSCSCNHLTSFSILMSPFAPDIAALAYITYAGITISMISLVICLIIEAIIWHRVRKNSTSFLRHVSIVNIALSLLIANIWFIIAANISDPGRQNAPACTAATFFIHFFYLAMFFWMLSSALLLVYRTMSVFGGGISDGGLLGIGFSLGYGAPLIIASITIASTAGAKKYIQKEVCWLNWFESKALLAFVIPALSIVVINLIILIVVLYKILRRRVGTNSTQEGEKHVLMVIAKSLAVLTPIFGLTWGLGIGTMVDARNVGIHIAFAFFNSLQGFFILVFGVLLDKRVISDLRETSQSIFSGTKSTNAGSSSSIFGFLRNRNYGGVSSGSSNGHSFGNT